MRTDVQRGAKSNMRREFLVGSRVACRLPNPTVTHHAAAGRVDEVADLIRDTSEGPATAADRMVMYWSIACSEGWARVDPTRTAELGADSYYGADMLEWAREVAFGCSLMPEGYFPAGDSDAVTSAVPVLLLNGMEDPQDPPTNVAHASVDFSQQFHDSGAGPGSHRRATWLSARRGGRVLRSGTAKGVDTNCVDQMAPTPFPTP